MNVLINTTDHSCSLELPDWCAPCDDYREIARRAVEEVQSDTRGPLSIIRHLNHNQQVEALNTIAQDFVWARAKGGMRVAMYGVP